ncbi:hypothetical protein K3495_g2554 [Podosphaera aphanis]|nr:hypothetical protein K3495_g2554 [Podosphaera aphanis]
MSNLSKKSYIWPWVQLSKTEKDKALSEPSQNLNNASSEISHNSDETLPEIPHTTDKALPEVSHNVDEVQLEVSHDKIKTSSESSQSEHETCKSTVEASSKTSGIPDTVNIQKVQFPPSSHWVRTLFQIRSLPPEAPALKSSVSSTELPKPHTKEIEFVEPFVFQEIEQPASSIWSFWSRSSDTKPELNMKLAPEKGKLLEESQILTKRSSEDNIEKVIHPSGGSMREVSKVKDFEAKSLQPRAAEQNKTILQSQISSKHSTSNLLLPSLKSTYQTVQSPSQLEKFARLLHLRQRPSVSHIFLSTDVPKIKKALAIGIHGLFPAPLLRTIIGQPTGTSIRFVNHAADAIRRWSIKNGLGECEVEKIALESEGKIFDRVSILWKYLLNHIHHVRTADFVLVACHSQGVPVAVMLVSKLIEFGALTSGRIGICAMAGVSLGPFAHYKSRLLTGSPAELFDLANPESEISKKYEHSLRIALNYGVRITFCGSIDDQLVSMDSAVFSTANHPYIYRAVFIDGRVHAPNFISHLVGLTLKMRNLGASDHGLIRELSGALAGSLYTGDGHSRLYDDEKVYDLAIEFALQTTSVNGIPLEVERKKTSLTANPYLLPWIMRGLLEEEIVKTKFNHEIKELLELYDAWKPLTKMLKDVKYRLEPVRSKL